MEVGVQYLLMCVFSWVIVIFWDNNGVLRWRWGLGMEMEF